MTWQLGNRLNWDNVATRTLTAVRTGPGVKDFNPLPPFTTIVDRPVLQVGIRNPTAPLVWKLGGYASQKLLMTPSITSDFLALVQTKSVFCSLGQLTLIEFPDYNLYPYSLVIEFPKWHENIYLEVWKYTP